LKVREKETGRRPEGNCSETCPQTAGKGGGGDLEKRGLREKKKVKKKKDYKKASGKDCQTREETPTPTRRERGRRGKGVPKKYRAKEES